MSEFKFSCPNCQQNLSATSEYSGAEIVCPKCQTPIVVPADPSAPPPPKGKLTMAASTVEHPSHQAPAAQATMRPRKKIPWRRYGTWAGWTAGICLGIWFGPKLWDKYQNRHVTALAKEAETNGPPPPPPELTAQEILKRTGAVYKAMTSYDAEAETHATIDLSRIYPNKKPQSTTTKLSIELIKPDHYKITWEQENSSIPKKGEGFSNAKGDFVKVGALTSKVKNREADLGMTARASESLFTFITELFFDDTNSIAAQATFFSRTNNQTLTGQSCYVIDGKIEAQNVSFWINRESFMVAQSEIVLGGNTNNAAFAGASPALKAQEIQMAKLKGEFIETYQTVSVNQKPAATPFERSSAEGASAQFAPAPGAPPGPRPRRPRLDSNNPMSHIRSAPP